MIARGNKIYIWNELHSIVDVSSIPGRSGEWSKLYHSARKRNREHHILKWAHSCFDLLLITFVFYIHNSLEQWAENKGVLLNCLMLFLTESMEAPLCYECNFCKML